jgi:hypothetical protein
VTKIRGTSGSVWQEGMNRNLERLFELSQEQTKGSMAFKISMDELLSEVRTLVVKGTTPVV